MSFGHLGAAGRGLGRMGAGSLGATPDAAETAAFLSRTSGLNAAHVAAYTSLINGLVADGVWAKLDLLQIYATQDQTTANLNLVSTSYTATLGGTPAWAADEGYSTAENETDYVSTGWAPSDGPNYQQNSCHVSAWSGLDLNQFRTLFELIAPPNAGHVFITPRLADNAYIRLNDDALGPDVASTNGSGFFGANRASFSFKQIFRSGAQMGADQAVNSQAPQSYILKSGTIEGGLIRSLGAGASLTAPEWANFYTRMAAYMAAIGASP